LGDARGVFFRSSDEGLSLNTRKKALLGVGSALAAMESSQ
jgi:hypothetical protein